MSDSPETTTEKDHGVLYLGIDLGTSRTCVAASNGVRASMSSYVGYPKDVVSRKLLKKDVLFGEEAEERRLSLHFYKPLEKGVLKASEAGGKEGEANQRAARDLIREIIRRARPRKDELIYAVVGVPAQASIKNKEAILAAAEEAVDSVMLCSEPFAVAYCLDWLDDVLVVDIGAGTVDLCRMHGTMPEDADQLTVYYAGDYIDQEFAKRIKAAHPEADFSIGMLKRFKEEYASVADQMERAIIELPVKGKPTPFDVTDELREACRLIIPHIVEALDQLVATFDPEFQSRLKNRVLLSGGGSLIKGLDHAVQDHMRKVLGEGTVIRAEDPFYGGAEGALKIAHDMPEDYWQKLK